MDFLRNRFFRQTLLCHSGETLDRNLGIEQLEGLLISSAVSPESSSVNLSPGVSQSFRTPEGAVLHTEAPLTKAAFCVLSEYWPRAVDQSTLFQQASKLLSKQLSGYDADQAWNTVLADLLHCYTTRAVEFHTWQAEFAGNTSALPKASKLAAYQLSRGLPIVNQRHETIHLDVLEKTLLAGLDGTRDHEALIGYLEKRVEEGTISVHREEQPITDGAVVNKALRQSLDQILPKLARAALLVD
jgi:methyltransferase-like protein